jgi:hypothetical protein
MATYRGEAKRVNLNTKGCDILLLKFTGQMTLDEGGLSEHIVSFILDKAATKHCPMFG